MKRDRIFYGVLVLMVGGLLVLAMGGREPADSASFRSAPPTAATPAVAKRCIRRCLSLACGCAASVARWTPWGRGVR